MTTHSAGLAESDTKHTKRWASKEWFSLVAVLLLLWTGLYLFAHSERGVQGYEFTKFTNAELRQIDNILAVPGYATRSNTQRLPESYNDAAYTDEFSETENSNLIQRSRTVVNTSEGSTTKQERIKKVMLFLKSQYGEDIHPDQKSNIEEYMNEFDRQQVMNFLSGMQLRVRSYFWLTGPKVYGEIIFWVIFGVLCSILFSISNIARKGNGLFANRDIIYQFSKIFYAPFLTIIIVLAYSYFKDSTTLNIVINEGIVVLAFFIGIASGAIMEIFDRIKYILFNGSSNNNSIEQDQPIRPQPQTQTPPAVTNNFPPIREQVYRPTPPPPPHDDEPVAAREPVKEPAVTEHAEDEVIDEPLEEINEPEEQIEEPKVEKEEDDSIISTPPQTVVEGKEKRPAHENEIEEVAIDLMLDFSGLFEEEKDEIQQTGFSKAIVTLHNVNGKDIIPARKLTDDMTTFVANNVKPGIYIARATLSQRMRNNQIMNLFGEKTAYITEDKPGLELFVKKYEAIS